MSAVPSSLSVRIVGYHALHDFIPLYPLYQLLFTDHGLSASEISTLFIIWSTTSFLLEVPSGAWADTFSRRRLLILGALIGGLGFASWIIFPSYAGFAAGFVLWGASSALVSGTFEAFVYDELAARDATDRYAGLLGLAKASALVLNLLATVLAAPLFELGGYPLVGVVSVLSCLVQAAVAVSLPEATRVASADETEAIEPAVSETGVRGMDVSRAGAIVDASDAGTVRPDGGGSARPGPLGRYKAMVRSGPLGRYNAMVRSGPLDRYKAMVRSGLTEVATARDVRKAVILVALLGGFLCFDEYFPLLARDVSASTTWVPLLIAGTVAAQAIGGALAGRAYRLRSSLIGAGLAVSAGLLALGALSQTAPGFIPIAIGYGVMQLVIVVAEARLQDAITGPARATVTSVSGLFAEVFAVAIFAGFAVGSVWVTLPVLVAALTVPLLLTAIITPAALPPPAGDPIADGSAAAADRAAADSAVAGSTATGSTATDLTATGPAEPDPPDPRPTAG